MLRYERWSVLAAMRFFLAAIVAVTHLADFAPLGILTIVMQLGAFEAILGFLLISGYSIGSSYQKKPEGFFKRRVARLYPIYLGAMVLTYAATPQPFTLALAVTLVINLLFLNQALTTGSFVGPAWSLSLEFWLYSLAPALFRMSARKLRLLIFLSFGFYTFYTIGRSLLRLPYYSGLGFGLNLLALAFMWVSGLRLAKEPEQRPKILRDIGLLLIAHIVLTTGIQFLYRLKHYALGQFLSTDSPELAARALTVFAVWVIFKLLLSERNPATRRSSFLRTMGDISYPLYLIHLPVYTLLSRVGLRSPWLLLVAAIAASWVLYTLLDFYSKRRDKVTEPLPAANPPTIVLPQTPKTIPVK